MVELFDFSYPQELVAHEPATPRDSARLLVGTHPAEPQHATFAELVQFLPARSVLVFNNTKVIPARFTAVKSTGGEVVCLYLTYSDERSIEILANRGLQTEQHIKWREFELVVLKKLEKGYRLRLLHHRVDDFIAALENYGSTPLPPYIKSPLHETERKKEYQTMFAEIPGSSAAPTASLHFTKELLGQLAAAGHTIVYITLHVGLGTFAPLTQQHLDSKTLHTEEYSIPERTSKILNQALRNNQPLVAVGTTVLRALESAALVAKQTHQAELIPALHNAKTNLFITPGFNFQTAQYLITNFHVPGSSLLLLVAAYAGETEIRSLYTVGVDKRYRLFSFGDGMLLRRKNFTFKTQAS